ncbi:hypothetical protein J6590_050851 [Homalodisca vitripennis]|nr:hypothetical protein J6590_050851 [Homalodisca vitripennis]
MTPIHSQVNKQRVRIAPEQFFQGKCPFSRSRLYDAPGHTACGYLVMGHRLVRRYLKAGYEVTSITKQLCRIYARAETPGAFSALTPTIRHGSGYVRSDINVTSPAQRLAQQYRVTPDCTLSGQKH